MNAEKPFLVACIPAVNEEKNLARVVLLAQRHVDKVIVCNDGSSDLTGEIAKRLGAEVIDHERNMGYGASLRSLFSKARQLNADVMVTLDADGQHDPSNIPTLVNPVIQGKADIVIGSRFLSEEGKNNVPTYRRRGIRLITGMARTVSFNHITDAQSGYRAYSKRALSLIDPTEFGMGASTEILLKAKEHEMSVVEVPVVMNYGKESNTHNPVTHGVGVILSIVKHFSIQRPLVFYGLPGALVFTIAMGFWVWALQIFATTSSLPTNMTLVAVFMTVVGLVLLTTAAILWVLISVLREKS